VGGGHGPSQSLRHERLGRWSTRFEVINLPQRSESVALLRVGTVQETLVASAASDPVSDLNFAQNPQLCRSLHRYVESLSVHTGAKQMLCRRPIGPTSSIGSPVLTAEKVSFYPTYHIK